MNIDFGKKLPGYLTEKRNIVTTILFTAGFALLFLNLYTPFGVATWFEVSKPTLLLYASGVILAGVLVVAVSRIIMYHFVKRGGKLRIWHYLVWVAAEILAMALFFTLFEIVILDDRRPFTELLTRSVQNTSLTLLLPYTFLWLWFSWRDNRERLSGIMEQPEAAGQRPMIHLRDEKGVLRMSLKHSDLLTLQGSDNYVTVCYQGQERLHRFMLRNTLRTLEEELKEEAIIRCHRSWLVNIEKVKLIRREKEGLLLELDSTPPSEVPVSRTYMHQVLAAFGHVE
ncbi:MAG: response regulator transcription factor [Bacteroidales bacterium]|nr:response regulator transcription factor [Bacteroidales bacterium]MCB9028467.1 response regulator transcription factor [Bacteroidales bacterium]HNT94422.1 LytTR family DNA-binding domain-containing protein [Bacteroidales bacterium]HOO67205.1 LytTR family DNA-binding domain-containing protein [Bacteroidales bacterium]HPE23127.1 LytTR family DNA-binding domain-containing protein [Bacteroidales bacterium]